MAQDAGYGTITLPQANPRRAVTPVPLAQHAAAATHAATHATAGTQASPFSLTPAQYAAKKAQQANVNRRNAILTNMDARLPGPSSFASQPAGYKAYERSTIPANTANMGLAASLAWKPPGPKAYAGPAYAPGTGLEAMGGLQNPYEMMGGG